MKKPAVMLSAFVFAVLSSVSLVAVAESMSACSGDAGRARYDVQRACYESYGPQSGKWSVVDRGALNLCLDTVSRQYTEEIVSCREMYMTPQRPPYENAENAATAAILTTILVYIMFSL